MESLPSISIFRENISIDDVIRELEIDKYPGARIAKITTDHTIDILIILYNSLRPNHPVSYRHFYGSNSIVNCFDLGQEVSDVDIARVSRVTSYKGSLRNKILVTFDLAGLKSKDQIELQEQTIGQLTKRTNATSPITKKTRKKRNRVMGTENKTLKLLDADINSNGDITFYFLTEITNEPSNTSPRETEHERGWRLTNNTSRTYELSIRFLDFIRKINEVQNYLEPAVIKDILYSSDVQLFSNSPSFQYQGMNYWLSQLNASIYPTGMYPHQWIHTHGDAIFDKHMSGFMNHIGFFAQQMISKTIKILKARQNYYS